MHWQVCCTLLVYSPRQYVNCILPDGCMRVSDLETFCTFEAGRLRVVIGGGCGLNFQPTTTFVRMTLSLLIS